MKDSRGLRPFNKLVSRRLKRQGLGEKSSGDLIMPKTTTKEWDPAKHFATEEDMAAYLEAALEEGDPALIAAALGDIARAKGMSRIARDAGRESL
jgi:hypothetical protein